MRLKFVVLLSAFFAFNAFAQSKGEWFPNALLVKPFKAGIFEPRLGAEFHPSNSTLELNISRSLDFYRNQTKDFLYSFGADFFTFTYLRQEANFHFPVETADYFFGVNFNLESKKSEMKWGVRSRISHISAHLVDGKFSSEKHDWLDGRKPFVYSREFVEISPFIYAGNLRFYATAAYVFHIDPAFLGKDYYDLGFDYYSNRNSSRSSASFFCGFDFRFNHLIHYEKIFYAKAGIRLGKGKGNALEIYTGFYAGKSLHGEYYDMNKEYLLIGFNWDI